MTGPVPPRSAWQQIGPVADPDHPVYWAEGRWIRIRDIGTEAPQCAVTLLATALTELGLAMSLVMTCGPQIGASRYEALGRPVRFNGDEPEIWLPSSEEHP